MSASALILGVLSLAVFLASLAVHAAAFVPGSGVRLEGPVSGLHLGAMAVFFATMAHGSLLNRRVRRAVGEGAATEKWMEGQIPGWLWGLGVALFLYAFVSGAAVMFTLPGQPRVWDGKLVLTSHGKVVREVGTEEEFRDWERWEVRAPSGLWMLFSAVPAAYFLVVYPRARAALDRQTAQAEPQPA